MAPTEDRVDRPEQRWGCHRGTPTSSMEDPWTVYWQQIEYWSLIQFSSWTGVRQTASEPACELKDHTQGRRVNGRHRLDREHSAGMECPPRTTLAACTQHSAATDHWTESEHTIKHSNCTSQCVNTMWHRHGSRRSCWSWFLLSLYCSIIHSLTQTSSSHTNLTTSAQRFTFPEKPYSISGVQCIVEPVYNSWFHDTTFSVKSGMIRRESMILRESFVKYLSKFSMQILSFAACRTLEHDDWPTVLLPCCTLFIWGNQYKAFHQRLYP